MLELDNVGKSYMGKKILHNFSMSFPQSGVFAILGTSGCGKTTLLRLIAGLEKPDYGTIHLPPKHVVSMVFQEDRLLDALDVRGNILAVLGRSDDAQLIADRCLDRCGLLSVAREYPPSLSGGMKRRVAIARALAFGGDILLLDEPFKGLDEKTKREVCDFVFEYNENRLTLLVTHDITEAETYAQRILRFSGTPLVLLEDSQWR